MAREVITVFVAKTKRGAAVLRAGGIRAAKTRAYRRAHAASYWSYCMDAGHTVEAMHACPDSVEQLVYDAWICMYDAMLPTVPRLKQYALDAAEYESTRALEELG